MQAECAGRIPHHWTRGHTVRYKIQELALEGTSPSVDPAIVPGDRPPSHALAGCWVLPVCALTLLLNLQLGCAAEVIVIILVVIRILLSITSYDHI